MNDILEGGAAGCFILQLAKFTTTRVDVEVSYRSMKIMKRARASGQTSLDCWLRKIKVAAENCKTSQFKNISVTACACVFLQHIVVWQSGRGHPKFFAQPPFLNSWIRLWFYS